MKKLAGKVALVTAATRNLGRGIALALAEDGADLVLHYRSEQVAGEAAALAAAVASHGVRACLIRADLTTRSEVVKLVAEARDRLGGVDILINNAGKIVKKPFVDISEQELDELFAINARAPFFAMQEVVRGMAPGGRIVNIGTSLLGATTGLYSAYAGSKAPLEHFTRALAKEVGERGITVNTVAPGAIETPFFYGQETPQSIAYVKSSHPGNRLAQIDEIVPMVRFLCSPDARWVSGQTIFVNAGYVAR